MFFHGPARKKHFSQLIIHAHQILTDKLERRLVTFGGYQDCLVNLANSLPHVHLQLPIPVGLLLRVWVLLLQGFHCCSNIVPVFSSVSPKASYSRAFPARRASSNWASPSFPSNLAFWTPFVSRSN